MKNEGALAFDTGVYGSERQASGVARASDGEGRAGVVLGRWVVAVVMAIVFAVIAAVVVTAVVAVITAIAAPAVGCCHCRPSS